MSSSSLLEELGSHRLLRYLFNGRKREVKFHTLHDLDMFVYELIALYRTKVQQLAAFNVDSHHAEVRITDGPAIERWKVLAPEILDG